ncbi:hypothetical protein C8F01DRAFT_1368375 [Mycena amicta]|nr:hypothetical protein C8F01DRAFT_1368375 [Mycena amicta]
MVLCHWDFLLLADSPFERFNTRVPALLPHAAYAFPPARSPSRDRTPSLTPSPLLFNFPPISTSFDTEQAPGLEEAVNVSPVSIPLLISFNMFIMFILFSLFNLFNDILGEFSASLRLSTV